MIEKSNIMLATKKQEDGWICLPVWKMKNEGAELSTFPNSAAAVILKAMASRKSSTNSTID